MSPHLKMKALDEAGTPYLAHVRWPDGSRSDDKGVEIYSHDPDWFETRHNGNILFHRFDKVEYFAVKELPAPDPKGA